MAIILMNDYSAPRLQFHRLQRLVPKKNSTTMLFKNLFIWASLAVLAHAKVNLHSLKQCGNFDSEKRLNIFIFYFISHISFRWI